MTASVEHSPKLFMLVVMEQFRYFVIILVYQIYKELVAPKGSTSFPDGGKSGLACVYCV